MQKNEMGNGRMETKRYQRRSFLKKSLLAAGSLAFLAGTSGLYSVYGERYWIETKTVRLAYRRLPVSFSGIRVVQFSDTHLGRDYSLSRMAEVVQKVQRQKPDLICFTGDLFDSEKGSVNDGVIPLLSRLKAELGKYAVLGNHDMRLNPIGVRDVLERSGFTVLVNANREAKRGGERIRVAGLDEMLYGAPNFDRALEGAGRDDFVLLLAHEPDFADTALKHPVDLQLSGHSHGGQIRIPLYGSLFIPDGGKKYPLGLYSLEGYEGRTFHIYTNRGIGTTLAPVRFNCRPEITVFVLEREASQV